MAKQPGNLNDLTGAARDEWNTVVAKLIVQAVNDSQTQHFVAQLPTNMTHPPDVVDWDGIPARVQTCLRSRNKAMELSDWTTGEGDRGRAVCHEEYMEWRTVRDPAGKITRVEITTEVQEYWITLARHDPVKLLARVAQFASEPTIPYQAVYGSVNPNAPSTTPDQREAGFRSMMLPRRGTLLPPRSPYNNGQKAICFLSQSVNSLGAAVFLAAFAGFPYAAVVGDGDPRPLTGAEAIASTKQSAVDCRNSDPTIVGAVIGQAFQGRQIALDDPPGLYITNVNAARLRQPDGQTLVPESWFNQMRGVPSDDGRPRAQRLVLEVPADLPFVVGDLIDSQTGETIDFGWQIAQLVKVGLYVRVGGSVPGGPRVEALKPTARCADQAECELYRRLHEEFLASQPQPEIQPSGAFGDAIERPSRIRGAYQ